MPGGAIAFEHKDADAERIDVARHFHPERLMRPVGVVPRDEVIEPGLLLQHIGGRRLRRFALQREVACAHVGRSVADALV